MRLRRGPDRLGDGSQALNWHGALSADVILTAEGPQFIDINPRLVEPVNAAASGVDLVGTLVEVATSGTGTRQPSGTPGVRTHQALLALLGVAAQTGRRRDILRDLLHAVTRSGNYRHSTEELTPVRWAGAGADSVAAIPVVAAALATLVRPAAWRHFAAGATSAYSLTPAAWRTLLDATAAGQDATRWRQREPETRSTRPFWRKIKVIQNGSVVPAPPNGLATARA